MLRPQNGNGNPGRGLRGRARTCGLGRGRGQTDKRRQGEEPPPDEEWCRGRGCLDKRCASSSAPLSDLSLLFSLAEDEHLAAEGGKNSSWRPKKAPFCAVSAVVCYQFYCTPKPGVRRASARAPPSQWQTRTRRRTRRRRVTRRSLSQSLLCAGCDDPAASFVRTRQRIEDAFGERVRRVSAMRKALSRPPPPPTRPRPPAARAPTFRRSRVCRRRRRSCSNEEEKECEKRILGEKASGGDRSISSSAAGTGNSCPSSPESIGWPASTSPVRERRRRVGPLGPVRSGLRRIVPRRRLPDRGVREGHYEEGGRPLGGQEEEEEEAAPEIEARRSRRRSRERRIR